MARKGREGTTLVSVRWWGQRMHLACVMVQIRRFLDRVKGMLAASCYEKI